MSEEAVSDGPVSVVGGVPVDSETCFTDHKGRAKPSLDKRVRGVLEKAAPMLAPVLEDGETVRFVTAASSPYSILELLTTGWVIANVKRCLLVVTDRRILHLPVKPSSEPRGSISQIRFGDLESAEVKGTLGKELRVRYRAGGKEKFQNLPAGAGKKLRQILESVELAAAAPSPVGRRHYLCPGCREGLDGVESLAEGSRCAVCGLEFKSRRRALLLSVLVPGGGYFYTGHPVLGLFDALTEGFLLLGLLSTLFLGPGVGPGVDPGAATADVWLFAALLAIEKLVTVYHAFHYVGELQPADSSFRPAASSAIGP